MSASLIAFPVIVAALMLQTAIISRLQVLNGHADLVMLVLIAWGFQSKDKSAWVWVLIAGFLVSQVSAVPYFLPLISYLIILGIIQVIKGQIWQMPFLSIFMITILGTFIQHGLSFIGLSISGLLLPFGDVLRFIIIPSALLNLVFLIPAFWMMRDLSHWVNSLEVDYE